VNEPSGPMTPSKLGVNVGAGGGVEPSRMVAPAAGGVASSGIGSSRYIQKVRVITRGHHALSRLGCHAKHCIHLRLSRPA
jgi:hypothetical protein